MADLGRVMARVDARGQAMVERLAGWSAINTASLNIPGLNEMRGRVAEAAAVLGGEMQEVAVPAWRVVDDAGVLREIELGKALVIRKRPGAMRRVLLSIHLDTVFAPDHAFQKPALMEDGTLRGPGVADAKGGLVVMLEALEAFEQSDVADGLGWTVVLNCDEELGSPGSVGLLVEAAAAHDVGLVFEPALPGGELIGERKGSGNFAVVVRGRAAHAGRDFAWGRNAIHEMAELVTGLAQLNHVMPGVTVNVGKVSGGGPVNVVPDLAICRFNVRVSERADEVQVMAAVEEMVAAVDGREGFAAELHGGFGAPPKVLDAGSLTLLQQLRAVGQELGLHLRWRGSGGVCDGNRLAAAGLAVVDTMGPRGGEIHSDSEYVVVESLAERAKLTAMMLMKWASGEVPLPGRVMGR